MEKKDALEALSALGQETRLEVFRLLVRSGPGGMTAGAIAQALAVRQNTLSSNLALLARAGLIEGRKEGRHIRYAADLEGLRRLLAFLLEDCCGGRPEACGPLLDRIFTQCRC
jgi:DNA-binding transcriptional ArsR family regulator